MSVRAQGFAAGAAVASLFYLTKKFEIQTQYDSVVRDIQRFHVNINPKHLPDHYPIVSQQQVRPKKDWLVGQPEDSKQALGKHPSDFWNRSLVVAYSAILKRVYSLTSVEQNQKPPQNKELL
eukprot:UN01115